MYDSILQVAMGKKEFTGKELEKADLKDFRAINAKTALYGFMTDNNMLDITNKEFLNDSKNTLTSDSVKKMQSGYMLLRIIAMIL